MYTISVILTYKKRATEYILMYIEQLVNGFSAWGTRNGFILRDPAPRSNSLPF